MQALCSAKDSGQRLYRDAHHVIFRLLCGERGACGLRMETQLPTRWFLCLEALAHDLRPQSARRAELGDLLQKVVMSVEEERELTGEIIHFESRLECGFHIG